MKSFPLILAVLAVVGCLIISNVRAAPSAKEKLPTKLKTVFNEKEGSKITEEERRFLKEVEAKFKINTKENDKVDIRKILDKKTKGLKLPFPAVIAVEIVNDTNSDGKGKRTIDANLGYGYKTNNGYFYQKFGGQEDKGKFMVYPYSQHDLPPSQSTGFSPSSHFSAVYTNKQKGEKTYVDIQPSKAYQLVPIDSHDQENTYNPNNVVSYLRNKYESVQSVETPPPPQYSAAEDYYQQHNTQTENPTTYYSTYNGHGQLSGFSGHFPSVMSNYYVNPSQLVGHSQNQELPGAQKEEIQGPKRVIPVFILRIPSSQISHEHASAFNQLNLQSLVSQYLAQLQPYIISKQVANQQAFYHQQRPAYASPSSTPQYAVPHTQFVPSEQVEYSQPQQYEEQSDHVQYIPQYQTKSRAPSSHTTFSEVYHSLARGQPQQQQAQYTHGEEDSQKLPISENYPDSHHTRVVFKPRYSEREQEQVYSQDEHASGYSSPSTESYEQAYRTTIHQQPQISIVHNGQAVEEDGQAEYESYAQQEAQVQEDGEQQQHYQPAQVQQYQLATQEEAQSPYNYHAHPYPKRQIKSSDTGTKKQSQQRQRRPLRSGMETAVTTKL